MTPHLKNRRFEMFELRLYIGKNSEVKDFCGNTLKNLKNNVSEWLHTYWKEALKDSRTTPDYMVKYYDISDSTWPNNETIESHTFRYKVSTGSWEISNGDAKETDIFFIYQNAIEEFLDSAFIDGELISVLNRNI